MPKALWVRLKRFWPGCRVMVWVPVPARFSVPVRFKLADGVLTRLPQRVRVFPPSVKFPEASVSTPSTVTLVARLAVPTLLMLRLLRLTLEIRLIDLRVPPFSTRVWALGV